MALESARCLGGRKSTAGPEGVERVMVEPRRSIISSSARRPIGLQESEEGNR